tara:strand:- start:20478 stop:21341 length:864 start_codon:yes stop_codon:yes gene_type:complete
MSFTEDELAEITTDIAIDNLRKQETITAQQREIEKLKNEYIKMERYLYDQINERNKITAAQHWEIVDLKNQLKEAEKKNKKIEVMLAEVLKSCNQVVEEDVIKKAEDVYKSQEALKKRIKLYEDESELVKRLKYLENENTILSWKLHDDEEYFIDLEKYQETLQSHIDKQKNEFEDYGKFCRKEIKRLKETLEFIDEEYAKLRNKYMYLEKNKIEDTEEYIKQKLEYQDYKIKELEADNKYYEKRLEEIKRITQDIRDKYRTEYQKKIEQDIKKVLEECSKKVNEYR